MTYTATYSPDDNKLRLYASSRLDPETYAKVKAAGFRWAPKQELFVAPMWTPGREDLLIELAGEVGDEDTSLVERAEERSERFEIYGESRKKEADAAYNAVGKIVENIPLGQPILVGHHSEARARKDVKRIQNGMDKAVKMWKQSEYWADRAAGAVRAAKYKELPNVRARRIKGIEKDKRAALKNVAECERDLKAWVKIRGVNDPEKQMGMALFVANYGRSCWSMSFPLAKYPREAPASQYEGPMGIWSALDGKVITPLQAAELMIPANERTIARNQRWLEHYDNRLAYEKAMLAESGGTATDQVKPEVGGAIKCWHFSQGWSLIQKVNKVTVTIWDSPQYGERVYRANVPFDKVREIMSKAQVDAARAAGTLREVGKGGKVYAFVLTDAPPPAPRAPEPESEDGAKFKALEQAAKAGVKVVVANQLFPTPKDLAQEVADLADIQPGDRVLEPSAGTGMLLGACGGRMFGHNPESGSVVAVEINPTLAAGLARDFPLTTVINADFLDMVAVEKKFDKILMNPPFENGADIKHIQHAATMLKPGGRLVAICANGPRQQAKLKPLAIEWRDLPAGTFKDQGTGVNTALIVIEKEAAPT